VKKPILIAALLPLAAACSSTPPVVAERAPDPTPVASAPAPAPDDVQHLAAYPSAGYEDLGVMQFTFFRPGILTPSLSAVMDELKSKVRQAGGNAFVVLNQSPDRADKRVLHLSAELLKVQSP
jgi:hypothetical protein